MSWLTRLWFWAMLVVCVVYHSPWAWVWAAVIALYEIPSAIIAACRVINKRLDQDDLTGR